MASTGTTVTVRVVAIRLTCSLCGARVDLARHGDAFEDHLDNITAWGHAHLRPALTAVRVSVNGLPAKWMTPSGRHL